MTKYQHVQRAVSGRPWFTTPEQLAAIAEIVQLRIDGGRLSVDEVEQRLEAAAANQGPRAGRGGAAVAVMPVYGTIFPRASLFTLMSGGASVDQLRATFREAMADDSVSALVMEFDSPGGQVDGIEELAAEIRDSRGRKPIVAIANTLMASAAYYLAAQADEIVASPSSLVGSIGVVYVHTDQSRKLDAEGITPTIIAIPKAKWEGSSLEPLSDDARAHLEQTAGDYYGQFVNAVAKGRGVSVETVRSGYGEGRVLTAKRALSAGMVDRVETLDDTIRRLSTGRVRPGRETSRAAALVTPDAWEGREPAAAIAATSRNCLDSGPGKKYRNPLMRSPPRATGTSHGCRHRGSPGRPRRGRRTTSGTGA